MKIKSIRAHEILDSRGDPTVEVELTLANGIKSVASVPSGASTGRHEAYELRDKDPRRYHGKGVLKACRNIEKKIFPKIKGHDVRKLNELDLTMVALDGTAHKNHLGANAILGVSLAAARAGAIVSSLPLYRYLRRLAGISLKTFRLPVPLFNVMNGGKHADTNVDFQEFMLVPQKKSVRASEHVRMAAEIFKTLGTVLHERRFDTDVGNEGGYAPHLPATVEAPKLIFEAVRRSGYTAGKDVALGLDIGASGLYDERTRRYIFRLDHAFLQAEHLLEVYEEWRKRYHLVLLEDGLAEDDWEGWEKLTQRLGKSLVLVGDDLFVTNTTRLKEGLSRGVANAALVKPNQIGTVTETLQFAKLAREANYKIVASHRSGETADTFITDLAVAIGADYLKAGAPSRGERVAKYNRLMEIERELM